MGVPSRIEIVAWRAEWTAAFENEAQAIRDCLGADALRIEHVGSTAVPGLAAKPVIDIQVSVRALEPLAPFVTGFGQMRYKFVSFGDFDRLYPFFHKPAEWPSTHHVHLCVAGGEQERKHLLFRDYLRLHPETAAEYAQLKRQLAERHVGATFDERENYSLAKTDFVNSILRMAGFSGEGRQ